MHSKQNCHTIDNNSVLYIVLNRIYMHSKQNCYTIDNNSVLYIVLNRIYMHSKQNCHTIDNNSVLYIVLNRIYMHSKQNCHTIDNNSVLYIVLNRNQVRRQSILKYWNVTNNFKKKKYIYILVFKTLIRHLTIETAGGSNKVAVQTSSIISFVWAADTQNLARPSIKGVAGKPTTTVANPRFKLSRLNFLQTVS